MSQRRKSTLAKARKYSDFLLYQATGGSMGKEFVAKEGFEDKTDFGDKRGLLDSLIKIAQLESKDKADEEPESQFDRIQRGVNGSKIAGNTDGTDAAGADTDDSDSDSSDE